MGAARTTLHNTIIADNQGIAQCFAGGNGTGGGVITSTGYNLSSDESCSLTGTADLPATDPQLEPLQPVMFTVVHPLPPTSPAIDSSDTNEVSDQIDNPRPVDVRECLTP